MSSAYRIDLIVEDQVVVEVKSLEHLLAVHQAQVLTYMRLTGLPAGLLINFNTPKLVDGAKRLINPRATAATSVSQSDDEQTERPPFLRFFVVNPLSS